MAKKYEKNDLQSLPECARDFIKLVIRKMRYRRKVRADVQAELAAHFEDELKDCATDEEKEQKAERLIENFGNVKLLAVLLRRAKRRCRPLWRTVVARTFQTIGVLILCFTAYMVWFLTGKPAVTVDYVAEANRLTCPVADESLNAAQLFDQAASICPNMPVGEGNFLQKSYIDANEAERQIIAEWVKLSADSLTLITQGTEKPYFWRQLKTSGDPDDDGAMMGIFLPDFTKFRHLAQSLCFRAQIQAARGEYSQAFDDLIICYKFGRLTSQGEKTIVEQLIGMGIQARAAKNIREILSLYPVGAEELTVLQADFAEAHAGQEFRIRLLFEKLTIYDEIQRCFTEDRLGGGHLYLRRIANWLIIEELASNNILHLANKNTLHILFTHPNKQETRETIDRYYGFWDKMVHKSPAQIRTEGIDTEKEAIQIIEGNLLLEFLVPAIGRIIELSHRIGVDVEATLAIIAILRYKQDTGDYPENLEELVAAGYLKKIPLDPFSDKPLVYKKTEGDFLLYSIGLNFKDDDGQVYRGKEGKRPHLWDDEFGDAVFWPVQK